MRTPLAAVAVVLLANLSLAQSPQLLVSDKPGEKPHPIALTRADVHVILAGPLSQTTMTLTFANDAGRVLEGELVFPLPENATVCAYALDVGGELVESVVIEKEKARIVFETEVRKGIDPGIPELGLDDGRLLRIAAHRLQQLKQFDLAIDLFEKISRLRPEEPQSFRDLALAHADRADASREPAQARLDYTRALELLHKVVMADWQRFEEIEVLALMEANRIMAKAGAEVSHSFDKRLVQLMDVDLRVVMTWDTDNTDIDLHVVEPSGEEANYSHNRTTIGGLVSKDFTQGYGPEEYALRKLMPGKYVIKANFYGNRDQKLVGPTTVQATVITNYGRADEKRQSLTLRLKDAKDMVEIGTVTLEGK